MRYSMVSAILMGFILVGYVWAGDPKIPQPDLCVEDSKVCRMLAVEVAKLDFSDFISRELDSNQRNSFLCPADNPQCCPPDLMPICLEVEKDLIVEARRQYQSVMASQFNDCPWNKEMCDSLGPFYCGPGGGWTPWGGCSPDIVFDPPYPPLPPKLCPCGTKPNIKGICIPKKCYRFGKEVPCSARPVCDRPVVLSKERAESTNFSRHLTDTQVQLEAAKQVHDDLKASLGVLDEEIKKLSKQKLEE